MESDIEYLKSEVRKLKHEFTSFLKEEVAAVVHCYGKRNGKALWEERMSRSKTKWKKNSLGRLEGRATSTNLITNKKKSSKPRRKPRRKTEYTPAEYKCKTCAKVFTNTMHYDKHMLGHLRESNDDAIGFSCPLCDKEFETVLSLLIHQSHHEQKPDAACLVCKSVFKTVEDLTLHHHSEHFVIPPSLMKMLKTYILRRKKFHRNVSHKCSYCSQQFPHIKLYNEHVLIHLEELNGGPIVFQCPFCETEIPTIAGLMNHIRQYPNTNTTCQKCNKTMKNNSLLAIHFYRDHFEASEEIKKFITDILAASFLNPRNIERRKRYRELRNCDTCGTTLRTQREYRKHVLLHDPDLENRGITYIRKISRSCETNGHIKCLVCDEDFESEQGLKKHLLSHTVSEMTAAGSNPKEALSLTKAKIYKCTVCQEKFFLILNLRKHILDFHYDNKELKKEFLFTCSTCDRSFFCISRLTLHKRLYCTNVECPICKEICQTHEEYVTHINDSHSDTSGKKFLKFEGGYLCKICGLTTSSDHLKIKAHITKKHADKPFACDICDKGFTLEKHLRSHKHSSHSKNAKLVCEECGKQFRTLSELRMHRKRHLDKTTRRVPCKECGKTFANRNSYNSHHISFHTNEKPYKCPVCSEAFTTASGLHLHKTLKCESSKAKISKCPICEKTFKNYVEMFHHKTSIHKFGNKEDDFCLKCNKKFKNASSLFLHCRMSHTESGENLSVACSVCDKILPNSALLFNHWLIHRPEKAFSCEVCNIFFKQKCGFVQHRKIRHKEDDIKPKLKTDNAMAAQLKKDFQKAHPLAKSVGAFPTAKQNSPQQNTAHSLANPSSNVVNMCSQEVEVPVTLANDNTNEIVNQRDNNESENTLHSSTDSNLKKIQHNGPQVVLGYIDFSRANVAEKLPSVSANLLIEIDENRASNVYTLTLSNDFSKNSTKEVGDDMEIEQEDYISNGEDSPMEQYNDDASDLDDPKPAMVENNRFPGDPFPKKLIIKLKRNGFGCGICNMDFDSSKLYNGHVSSRFHRATFRKNKLELNSILKKEKEVRRDKRKNCNKEINIKKGNESKIKETKRTKERKPGKVKCPKEKVKISTKRANNSVGKVKASPKKKDGSKIRAKLGECSKEKECFSCPYCDEKFFTTNKYRSHVVTHKKKMKCLLCTEKFASARKLVEHYKNEHNGQMVVNCKLCEASYLDYTDALRDHMDYAHKELEGPNKSKTTVKLYKCDICDEKCSNHKEIKMHLLSHNNEHKCVQCTEVFKSPSELETHYNDSHGGEMPFTCNECPQKFCTEVRLQLHKKEIHLPQKFSRDSTDGKFVCDVCGARYQRKADFVNHLPIHDAKEDRHKFVCEFCSKTFLRIHSLVIHKRTHTNEKPFLCDQCEMAFISPAILKEHIDGVHKKILTCDICGKSLSNLKNLKKHKKIHSNKDVTHSCSQCSKTFSTLGQLETHIKKVHSSKASSSVFTCEFCSIEFYEQKSFEKHSQLHDSKRPFGCDECSFRFNFTSNLTLHKKKVHQQ